jgi:hypothetical protein
MRQAWAHWRYARWKGWHELPEPDRWTWPRCLRFAAAQHRARRASFSAVEAAMHALVADQGPRV